MQTVEHLEGTMTDSEEGHASEVNLHFIRDGPRDKRHFFFYLSEGFTRSETRKNPECCAVIMKVHRFA